MKEDKVLPVWITVPTLSKDHLPICSCKKECKPLVDVLEEKICCTSLCSCRGSCYGQPKF